MMKIQTQRHSLRRLSLALLTTLAVTTPFFITATAQTSRENTVLSTAEDRTDLSMTVYQNGLAMVQDARKVDLLQGVQMLAFENVSNQLIPASALFAGEQITILQQVFDYALMSTENMLRLSTGKDIQLARINPKTGEEVRETATIITTKPQLIVKTKNGIQANPSGTVIFEAIPEGLSKAPALKLFLDAQRAGVQGVDLTYLTDGLSWKADYIAKLNTARNKMSLRAFATVTNNTEIAYQNTTMNVVAGDVPRNYIIQAQKPDQMVYEMAMPVAMKAAPRHEAIGNVQLFKLPTKVSIESQQTRQFPLLPLVEMEITEILTATHYFDGQQENIDPNQIERPTVQIRFKNTSKSPLPQGELRIYETDSDNKDHLTGELRINDTAENEVTDLQLGQAYNFKVMRKQLEWKPILDYQQRQIGGVAKYEITVSNAGNQESTVNLVENFSGITDIKNESIKGEKISSSAIKWQIKVPARGEATLSYTISTRSQ